MTTLLPLAWTDWLHLFGHYLLLSLLSDGGGITTAPEMQRYLVLQQHWLTSTQFNSSIALAQAAPGPNILFVALLGWNIGLNSGGILHGFLGVGVTMLGMLLPSTTLTYVLSRWGHKNGKLRAVRAFKQGLAPIVIALLLATSWTLALTNNNGVHSWQLWLLTAVTVVIVLRTRLHLLWLLGAGALLGSLGFL